MLKYTIVLIVLHNLQNNKNYFSITSFTKRKKNYLNLFFCNDNKKVGFINAFVVVFLNAKMKV